jgi:2,3-bisphosphoglycerate-dependent phosphoglycerate mutase
MTRKKTFLTGVLIFIASHLVAQKSTFIILRHAEKDTTIAGSTMMASDPPLTSKGENRALEIVEKFNSFRINQVYSTNYKRTKSTVLPIANARQLNVTTYDPRKLEALATELLSDTNKGKNFLIVGHSNTSPKLVNLLIKKDQFKDLADADYATYWIVTIKKNKTKVKQMQF